MTLVRGRRAKSVHPASRCQKQKGRRHTLREVERNGEIDENLTAQVSLPAAARASKAPAPAVQLNMTSPWAAASAKVPCEALGPASFIQAVAFSLAPLRDPIFTS